MPTLPLYDEPANRDTWHRVRAPGGYEWWRFSAKDTAAASGNRVLIDFFDGDPFNSAYQAAYAAYRRRPTRVVPPVPRDYPCVRVEVAEKDRALARVDALHPAGSFSASADGREIRIASNVIQFVEAGTVRVSVENVATLAFEPLEPHPPELRQLPGDEPTIVHFRMTACRSYRVTGTLTAANREIAFDGRGAVTHFFGTGPIGKTTGFY